MSYFNDQQETFNPCETSQEQKTLFVLVVYVNKNIILDKQKLYCSITLHVTRVTLINTCIRTGFELNIFIMLIISLNVLCTSLLPDLPLWTRNYITQILLLIQHKHVDDYCT